MSLDVDVDALVESLDVAALQRLRLARRRYDKVVKEYLRSERRMIKARRKLFERINEVEARGLDQLDPRSMD